MPGLLLSTPSCTNTTMARSSSSSSPFSSPSPSPPPHFHRQPHPIFTSTIHHRRTLSRANTSNSGTTTPPLIHSLDFGLSRINHSQNHNGTNALSEVHEGEQIEGNESPLSKLETSFFNSWKGESDAETWERMLALQKEYRCYNSARVEAAVEALEKGWKIEDMSVRKFILPVFF